ncbi:MAG: UDP-N-acetylmuramate dehydrogenase [Bacilli bacterium]|nr:UDP-N-acetylmuramate dehydrogenase [Bacilli bacterium]
MKKIENAEIKNITTYKLKGSIKKLIIAESIDDLKEIIESLKGQKYKIIGNGSNLIISSSYDGTIIKLKGIDGLIVNGNVIKVGASYNLAKLSRECAKRGLSGLEFACGIPGTVGGAIYMNAGAYGKEMKDITESVIALDENGKRVTLTKDELKFGYRNSIFKTKNYICLQVKLKLKKDKKEDILKRINDIMKERREKQPLEYPSAGSVFRNPENDSAGRIIESLNLKGLKVGGAEVSEKHANFIVNKGDATAEDIIEIIDKIKEKVKEKYNIELMCEQEIIKG